MPSYADAEKTLTDRLGESSLEHCRRVAETAAALAAVYGVDTERARIAGLLHDWDREAGPERLLSSADDAGMSLTDTDRSIPYLLHARTGAAGVRVAFPDLDDDVVAAIEHHTVGAGDMSDLDMVVYIADMIEPARGYPGVDDLREVVGTVDLDALYARGYEQTLRHLIETRRPLHPHTVAAWNAIVAKEAR